MSRIGKKPVADPRGRHRQRRGPDRQGEGAEGRAAARAARRRRGQAGQGRDQGRAARRDQARARHVGHVAPLVANLVTGVTKGFEKQARDHRRRLSRRGAGQEPAAAARLQPRRRLSDPGRHHDRDAEADRDRDHRHRQAEGRAGGGRDPRLPPARALQGQGRAGTPASTSSARKARRSNGSGPWRSSRNRTERRKATRAPRASRRAADGRRAAVGVPLVEAHLRAGHRRRQGRDARVAPRRSRRTLREQPQDRRQHRRRPRRSASWSPSAPRRRASRTWCSTAAAISITAASRRWPMPRARAD